MALTKLDYLRHLQALLPPGAAWPVDDEAVLTRLLSAWADELERVDTRAGQLLMEADPRLTTDMLTDWERVAGLPDDFFSDRTEREQSLTVPQRRAALVTRLISVGGQSINYFIGLAAALGYTITIREFRSFRAGYSRSQDALTNGPWKFAWQVNGPLNDNIAFEAGQAVAGDPLNIWGNELLERVLNRFKPAHTKIIFAYT